MALAISRTILQSSPIPTKTCSHYGDTDKRLSVCGRCHIEKYCGRACQSYAWPKHKQACVPDTKKETSIPQKSVSYDFKPITTLKESATKSMLPLSNRAKKPMPRDLDDEYLSLHGSYLSLKIHF